MADEKKNMENEYEDMKNEQKKKPNKFVQVLFKIAPWAAVIIGGSGIGYGVSRGMAKGFAKTLQDNDSIIRSLTTNLEEVTAKADSLADEVSRIASERDMLKSIMNPVNAAKAAEEFSEKINF